ncbi:NADH dehydrogenase [ubiquinone] 1 alpha subcomplex subunit 8 [Lingula anatina]|uniref:NADH dehydrogenase [ubiquinone] 1 alpha subcomplex subunit 8 n=1 Tax=Lingula anatina TaxID=7574 RepID=A0A1S3HT61_LINAN|nr:NADH dehydrogenase [ubiquinone] 1 alpha subcomplex subunit 8 [Lingula anatina]|eukprot:XP_013389227.1 NADH dehydrogenase [ubiquinone] 1 alpha subcomplex subunit 8 [Lingula anatina]
MAAHGDEYLPTWEEVTVPELKVTSIALRAIATQMGKYCDEPSKEFMLCRTETGDPRKCLKAGRDVTRCGHEFLIKVKERCANQFQEYTDCLDYVPHRQLKFSFFGCKKLMKAFDQCILENFNQTAPEVGYFSRVRVQSTSQPRPDPLQGQPKPSEEIRLEPGE